MSTVIILIVSAVVLGMYVDLYLASRRITRNTAELVDLTRQLLEQNTRPAIPPQPMPYQPHPGPMPRR